MQGRLESFARTLCWEDRPAIIRAIALFTLKVHAVNDCPMSLSRQRAKVFAALAMLEHLDSLHEEDVSIQERMLLPGYVDLMGFALRNGWTTIRRIEGASDYLQNFTARVSNSAMIIEMVEFSYRYARRFSDWTAGFTLARDFICEKYRTTTGYSRSSVTSRWDSYQRGSTAVLIYLMAHPNYRLLSSDVSDASFCETLLQEVEHRDKLKSLFADYIVVTNKLRPHGYDNERVDIPELNKIARSRSFEMGEFSERDMKIVEMIRDKKAR